MKDKTKKIFINKDTSHNSKLTIKKTDFVVFFYIFYCLNNNTESVKCFNDLCITLLQCLNYMWYQHVRNIYVLLVYLHLFWRTRCSRGCPTNSSVFSISKCLHNILFQRTKSKLVVGGVVCKGNQWRFAALFAR